MKLLAAFFRLVRWPNLVFIALTQVLFYYAVVLPSLEQVKLQPVLTVNLIFLLALSNALIAAGGNVINDYFDLNIDKINKPEKLVVEKYISRRWVIIWHLLLSLSGIYCSILVAKRTNNWLIAVAAIVCVLFLFFYSSSLKKKFLIGNILVSALTAWVIMLVSLVEFSPYHQVPEHIAAFRRIMRLGIVYTSFAFIISLIREVVKDMEDVEGDRRYGCTTMPIVWGLNSTKVFVAVWLIVLIAALVLLQAYAVTFGWWISIGFAFIFIIAPLVWIFKKLFKAQSPEDFHALSTVIKLVMFSGIISMLFFRFYV